MLHLSLELDSTSSNLSVKDSDTDTVRAALLGAGLVEFTDTDAENFFFLDADGLADDFGDHGLSLDDYSDESFFLSDAAEATGNSNCYEGAMTVTELLAHVWNWSGQA